MWMGVGMSAQEEGIPLGWAFWEGVHTSSPVIAFWGEGTSH